MAHDEHEEPDQHQEVQRSCRLNAQQLADPLEASRQGRGHAEPGDERGRCGDKDRDEVGEQLKTVVGDPAVLGRPVQRQVLDQYRHCIRKHSPGGRHHPTPLSGREQQDIEDEAVEQPQRIGPEMPPAGQADRVADPRQPDLSRQADRVLLRRPQRLVRNRLLDAKPVLAGSAVPRPVQPRMITEDLQSRPDDEDQQEQVEEVLHANPDRQPGTRLGARGPTVPGYRTMKRSTDGTLRRPFAAATATIKPGTRSVAATAG